METGSQAPPGIFHFRGFTLREMTGRLGLRNQMRVSASALHSHFEA
jgi:hypothetical protein